jgi:hypothetical protein
VFTALVQPFPASTAEAELRGPFITAPQANITAGRLHVSEVASATLIEVRSRDRQWSVILPPHERMIVLPASLGVQADTVALGRTALRSPRTYAELLESGWAGALYDERGQVAVASVDP